MRRAKCAEKCVAHGFRADGLGGCTGGGTFRSVCAVDVHLYGCKTCVGPLKCENLAGRRSFDIETIARGGVCDGFDVGSVVQADGLKQRHWSTEAIAGRRVGEQRGPKLFGCETCRNGHVLKAALLRQRLTRSCRNVVWAGRHRMLKLRAGPDGWGG